MCSLKKIPYNIICIFFFGFNSAFALELIPIESSITIINAGQPVTETKVNPKALYQIAESVITPDYALTEISYNQKVGVLSFRVLSPTRSKVKIKWDNEGFMFPRFGGDEFAFARPGATRQISFNVTKPMSGVFSIYNTNNKLLTKVPYIVKKQSRFTQSLISRFNEGASSGNDDNQSFSLGYSIGTRGQRGQPRWRGGVNHSTNLDDSSETTSVFVGVNW